MLVHVPPPIQTEDGKAGKGNFWHEATFGFKYIFQRKPMLAYVILIFIANLFLGFPNSVHVPMVLSRTGNDSLILGSVQTAGAISWTVGSLIMSAWGGPKRRIYGTLFGWMFYCLFGNVLFALGQGLASWIPLILLAGLGSNVGIATSQAILQAKVAPMCRVASSPPAACSPGFLIPLLRYLEESSQIALWSLLCVLKPGLLTPLGGWSAPLPAPGWR